MPKHLNNELTNKQIKWVLCVHSSMLSTVVHTTKHSKNIAFKVFQKIFHHRSAKLFSS